MKKNKYERKKVKRYGTTVLGRKFGKIAERIGRLPISFIPGRKPSDSNVSVQQAVSLLFLKKFKSDEPNHPALSRGSSKDRFSW